MSTPHGTFSQFVRARYLSKWDSFPNFKARPTRLKGIIQIPSCRHLRLRREIIAPKEVQFAKQPVVRPNVMEGKRIFLLSLNARRVRLPDEPKPAHARCIF